MRFVRARSDVGHRMDLCPSPRVLSVCAAGLDPKLYRVPRQQPGEGMLADVGARDPVVASKEGATARAGPFAGDRVGWDDGDAGGIGRARVYGVDLKVLGLPDPLARASPPVATSWPGRMVSQSCCARKAAVSCAWTRSTDQSRRSGWLSMLSARRALSSAQMVPVAMKAQCCSSARAWPPTGWISRMERALWSGLASRAGAGGGCRHVAGRPPARRRRVCLRLEIGTIPSRKDEADSDHPRRSLARPRVRHLHHSGPLPGISRPRGQSQVMVPFVWDIDPPILRSARIGGPSRRVSAGSHPPASRCPDWSAGAPSGRGPRHRG